MAEPRKRWRTGLGWILTVAILAYAISDWGGAGETTPADVAEGASASELRITAISDGDVNPGDAVVVHYAGVDPALPPVEATLARKPAEILVREGDSVVVRISADVQLGKIGLRVTQGTKRSKAWDLHVRATNHRKLVARLLGGLALFVFGLGVLALGSRGLAGHRLRALLGRLTESPRRAVGIGTLVGAVTQLTSSSAAFVMSLVQARLLAVAPTIAILVGAQLGASITGALLPVQLARESLIVIAIGVLWTRLAVSRRGGAIANLVLGAGLMLYGLHLLQTSVEPLVSDPKMLPYVGYLRASGITAVLTCAATGAVLALVLQGPGPVYVLVVGLAQTSGALPLDNALAILVGTNLGAALGMAVIAWQSGAATAPVARAHLVFGAAATVIGLATIPAWTALATAIMPAGDALDYGHAVLRGTIAGQLAVAFVCAQLATVGLWLAVLPALVARAARGRQVADSAGPAPEAVALLALRELGEVFDDQRAALAAALETSCSGERAHSAAHEQSLGDARRRLEERYRALGTTAADGPQVDRVAQTLVATLQLQRAIEQAVHVAELGVERGVRLGDDAQARLRAIYALAREAFDALTTAIARGSAPDLEDAGAREIRMNALEAEGRAASAAGRGRDRHTTASLRLGLTELIDSYETVGNHLFRVARTLGDDADELA
jgi:phosphate:Na+ symporter